MSSDRHHQSDSLASLWVCRDRVLNLVIYEIVFHIYFANFFFGTCVFHFGHSFCGLPRQLQPPYGAFRLGFSFGRGGGGLGFDGWGLRGMVSNATPENVTLHSWSMRSSRMLPSDSFCSSFTKFFSLFRFYFFHFFFFFVWVVETLVILSMAAAFGAAYPRKYPQSGAHPAKSVRHFGTPFSHKHFNEKYQRNCFWNCFICHKQNACQISLMLFMCILWRMRHHPANHFHRPSSQFYFKALAKFSPSTYLIWPPTHGYHFSFFSSLAYFRFWYFN